MSGTCFERPVGAIADVNELEYISSLHQTGATLRMDGSIRDEDVRLFLLSRYGTDVSTETVRETILRGFGCVSDKDSSPGEIDLMELVGILIIPTLLKASAVHRGIEMQEGLLLPPSELIQFSLNVILHDATGDRSPKRLDIELLRKIFEAYGETEHAFDDALLQEMISCCSEDGEETFLTVDTFCKALTNDVQLYDLNNEVRETTNIQDVFKTQEKKESLSPTDEEEGLQKGRPMKLKRMFTAPAIDFTAGTYRSKGLAIIIWATTLITYFADIHNEGRESAAKVCSDSDYEYIPTAPWRNNRGAVACETGISIFLWVLFFGVFAIYGLCAVGLGSIGNHVHCKHWWAPLIGACFLLALTIPGFVENQRASTTSVRYLSLVSVCLGLTGFVMHIFHAASMIVPKAIVEKYDLVKALLRSSTIIGEMDLKRASSRKVHEMLHNAISVVERHEKEAVLNTHFSQGVFNFSSYGIRRTEEIGGLRWTWRNLMNRKLFRKEGIWYSVRLSASNLAQVLIILYIIIEGSRLTKHVNLNFSSDTAKTDLRNVMDYVIDSRVDQELVDSMAEQVSTIFVDFLTSSDKDTISVNCTGFATESAESMLVDYCNITDGYWQCEQSADVNFVCGLLGDSSLMGGLESLGLLNASGLDGDSLVALSQQVLQESVDSTVDSLYPAHKYMVTVPMIIGLVAAVLCALWLSMTYAASVTSTILKLRCGVIPSLQRPDFARLRAAPDTVSLLTGSLFWGCLGSSILVGSFVGGLLFLFLWQGSVYFAQRVTALAAGILIITLARLGMVCFCRRRYYTAFYRHRPASANIALLALEWANFALSAGFVLVRALKLILVAGFSIGRVDRPFLADGVGLLGPIELDGLPTIHTRDLLLNEAHRHPYIELLGTMYLMKLRYADQFGQTAGSCWRLIFVYALFPWLHKYRVMARPTLFVDTDTSLSHPGSDLRKRSLHFISLRNLFQAAAMSESSFEAIDPQLVKIEEQQLEDKPAGSEKVGLKNEAKIQELEEEVARLKSKLQSVEQRLALSNT